MPPTEKTIRIFISSTFRDMHSERDHLVTVVFPELRERLEQLNLELYDVDLRWGVPEKGPDGEIANSWDYCKKWIERVEPFFISLLGQRYGWIPPESEIRDRRDRAIYKGMSITEMEIRHAVLSGDLYRRSFFYFRDTVVPEDTPPDVYREFVDPNEQERLRHFKEEIAISGQTVRHYGCRWTGIGFDNLDAFGRMVLEDLWSGVLRDERYVSKKAWEKVLGHAPESDLLYKDDSQPLPQGFWQEVVAAAKPAPSNPLELEAEQMSDFAAGRLRWFRGRVSELKQLYSFIKTDDVSISSSRLCVVRAVAGQGKSSLLAKLAEQLDNTPYLVITHFVGATERGSSSRSLLERLDQELERNGILAPNENEHAHNLESLSKRFAQRLENYSGKRQIVLLIDAINQLSDGQDLFWLPSRLGSSVRIILSTIVEPATATEGGETSVLAALRTRKPQPQWVNVGPLNEKDVRAIVVDYLHEYCKELDSAHIEIICNMDQSRNPLYLLVMLNELRTLGGNDMNKIVPQLITEMKTNYPDIVQLFDWVLQRMEIFGKETVKLWCIYLALGREGMSSRELSDLVAQKLANGAARTALLIERGLRRYLQKRGQQLDFFHNQLRDAVKRRYMPKDVTPYHAEIANYFETRWSEPNLHSLSELPFHLARSNNFGLLKSLYTDFSYLETACTLLDAYHMPNGEVDYRGIFEVLSGIQDVLQVLKVQLESEKEVADLSGYLQAVSDVLLDRGLLLRKHPEALAQEIANYIDLKSVANIGLNKNILKGVRKGLLIKKRILTVPTIPGHTAEITVIAASPSGRHFLTGGRDGYVGFWQIDRPQPLWLISAHKSEVTNVSFSPDGQRGLSTGDDGVVFLWEVNRGQNQQLFDEYLGSSKTSQWPISFGEFLDDNTLLILRAGDIKYEISSGREVWRKFEISSRFGRHNQRFMDFSPHAKVIAMGDGNSLFNSQQIEVYDADMGERLSTLECSSVISRLALSADADTVLAVDSQGRLRAYETRTGKQVASIQTEPFYGLCRSYNKRFFFAYNIRGELYKISYANKLQIESRDSVELRNLDPFTTSTMTCLPDNRTLVVGGSHGTLHLIDWENARMLQKWGASTSFLMGTIFLNGRGALGVQGARISGEAKAGYGLILIGSSGKQNAIHKSPHSQRISGVAAIDSQRAVTVDKGGLAAFWKRRRVVKLHKINQTDFTSCAAWRTAGLGVGGTQHDEVIVFGPGERTIAHQFPGGGFMLGESSGIVALAVDGKPLAIFAVYSSGAVRFAQDRRYWQTQGHNLLGSAAALAIEHQLAASGDISGEIRVWHCLTNDFKMEEYHTHQGEVTALAFGLDGKFLYSAGSDRFICEIDLSLKKVTRSTVLPTLPIALLVEKGGKLSALDSQGNVYQFLTHSVEVSRSRSWNWIETAARFLKL